MTILTAGAGEIDAGSAVSTSVLGGSWMSVQAGGVASGTTVSGVLFVSGTASGTRIWRKGVRLVGRHRHWSDCFSRRHPPYFRGWDGERHGAGRWRRG